MSSTIKNEYGRTYFRPTICIPDYFKPILDALKEENVNFSGLIQKMLIKEAESRSITLNLPQRFKTVEKDCKTSKKECILQPMYCMPDFMQ